MGTDMKCESCFLAARIILRLFALILVYNTSFQLFSHITSVTVFVTLNQKKGYGHLSHFWLPISMFRSLASSSLTPFFLDFLVVSMPCCRLSCHVSQIRPSQATCCSVFDVLKYQHPKPCSFQTLQTHFLICKTFIHDTSNKLLTSPFTCLVFQSLMLFHLETHNRVQHNVCQPKLPQTSNYEEMSLVHSNSNIHTRKFISVESQFR